ncbi:MAG: hypothetical protein KDA24_21160 [Deltaproteobacteria bacterium]|nr:hypothetical protein [Deltaproteobacteria bacterium]
MRRSAFRLLPAVLLLAGCPSEDPPDTTPPPDSFCTQHGWTERAFQTEGVFGSQRRDLADDFWVETTAGRWSFDEEWTGCETYLFVPDIIDVSPLDNTSVLAKVDDLSELIAKSPDNAHYFFVTAGDEDDFADTMEDRLDDVLDALDDEDADWWRPRLHIVAVSMTDMGGWVERAMTSSGEGFAIDRFQRVRGFGQLADVTRYSSQLNNAGQWPWEQNVAYVAHEAQYYNHESDRQDRLDAEDWTEAWVFYDENIQATGRHTAVAHLPDEATMATFDTMWLDVRHACDTNSREFGNCDAWDAGNRIHLCDDADDPDACDTLLGRLITTYHREGRWLIEASDALPHVLAGGDQRIRYVGARGGHFISVRVLLANTGKGSEPYRIDPLWTGGGWNEEYDANHPPITIDVPADAARTHLVVTVTGHGQGGDDNCAEFCNHIHTFTVAGEEFVAEHPNMGDQEGCLKQIDLGTVPNQHGTWWFERSSWCPGKQVDPWVFDITDQVTPGQSAEISYTTNYGQFDDGNINLQSWVTYWK